jgi:hypothetical protein
METRKMLTISRLRSGWRAILVFGLMFCLAEVGEAAEMGMAFTYQGHLYDANYVANGLYDLAFKLYDANSDGNKVGTDVNVADVDVIDAYFTVELDFGSSVFDGDAVWLEIGVRPGEMNDPNGYTTLSPRQEVTPTPYAIYAKTAGSDNDWMLSGNDMYSIPSGNIGIGEAAPYAKLHIGDVPSDGDGLLMIGPSFGGSARIGLRTNTGSGNFENEWHLLAEAGGKFHIVDGRSFDVAPSGIERISIATNGNVGIGTTSPGAKLDVNGPIKITDGSQGAGKVLTSDASGLASWQSPTAGSDSDWMLSGNDMYSIPSGNVGIGTTSPHPSVKLEVRSSASGGAAVAGYATGDDSIGVLGNSSGLAGIYGSAYGLGSSADYAGYFYGDVHVTGNLSKGSGSFVIDHPLDPDNKYLQHSFVESPDMMNIYNGNIKLDKNGQATVHLPEYFKALNQDFRYQLTAIGVPAPNLYIVEKISGNRFKIAGGKPGMEVSWQVTGIRHDPYAVAHRIIVEEEKPIEARGYYLHPDAYGLTEEKSIAVQNLQSSKSRVVARNLNEYNQEGDLK